VQTLNARSRSHRQWLEAARIELCIEALRLFPSIEAHIPQIVMNSRQDEVVMTTHVIKHVQSKALS
jgi:hypothetical protein